MNNQLTVALGAIGGGMVSNGIANVLPDNIKEKPLVNIGLAGLSVFGAMRVSGTDSKSNALRGALLGSAVVQAIKGVAKFVSNNQSVSSKLEGTSATKKFARGAFGLNGAMEEEYALNAPNVFVGGDGMLYQTDPTGLNGLVMDENGNLYDNGLNAGYDDGLNGCGCDSGLNGDVLDDIYSSGMNGSIEDVYGLEGDFDGLNGGEFEEIYQ